MHAGCVCRLMWMRVWQPVPPDSIHIQGQAGGVHWAADDSLHHRISPSLDPQRSPWREGTWRCPRHWCGSRQGGQGGCGKLLWWQQQRGLPQLLLWGCTAGGPCRLGCCLGGCAARSGGCMIAEGPGGASASVLRQLRAHTCSPRLRRLWAWLLHARLGTSCWSLISLRQQALQNGFRLDGMGSGVWSVASLRRQSISSWQRVGSCRVWGHQLWAASTCRTLGVLSQQ